MDKISISNIVIDSEVNTMDEAFQEVAKLSEKLGYVKNYEQYLEALKTREKQGSTGLEEGFAIPHGIIDDISEGTIFFVKYKNDLEWETFDNKPVRNCVYFLIPKNNNNHLKNLSLISQGLMDKEKFNILSKTKNKQEICDVFESMLLDEEEQRKESDSSISIVGVVACPAGLAHTYMAKKALEVACEKLGYKYQIEAHGAMGVENKISQEEIEGATVFIQATDIGVELEGRFDNLYNHKVKTKDVIKDASKVIKQALEMKNAFVKIDSKRTTSVKFKTENSTKTNLKGQTFGYKIKWFGGEIMGHLMTGIGYIIPLVIAASVMIGISRLIATAMGYDDLWAIFNGKDGIATGEQGILGWLWALEIMGTKFGLQDLFIPMLTGFICFSIVGKGGLAPGFIIGSIVVLLQMGFIGGMVAALFTGYLVYFIQKYMVIKGSWQSLTPILFVPVIGSIVGGSFTWFVLGFPFAQLNIALTNGLKALGDNDAGPILLAIVFSAMVAFDLGGPVNKAAFGVSLGLFQTYASDLQNNGFADDILIVPNTAVQISIILPPLALGIASLIGNIYYSQELKDAGKAAFIMGLVGVSEGAIPFAIKNPIRVTAFNMLGAIVASTTAIGLGSRSSVQLSAIYAWGFPTHAWFYILGIFFGTLVIIIPNVMLAKLNWHKENNIKFKIFSPLRSFKIFGLNISNIFRKKENKLTIPKSSAQIALENSENEIVKTRL